MSLALRGALLGKRQFQPPMLAGLKLWLTADRSRITQTEIQTATPTGTWVSGTFTLALDGVPTGAIAFDASAAAVTSALVAAFGAGTFTTAGSAGGPWTITAAGSKAEAAVSVLVADVTNIAGVTPGLTMARTSRGYSVPVDGDTVQTWYDLSGNGNNFTQATISQRPLFKTNIVNGKPAVLFDGTDDYLSGTFNPTGNGMTVAAAFKTGGAIPTYSGILGSGGAAGTGSIRWNFGPGSNGTQGMGWGGPTANVNFGSGAAHAINTAYVDSWRTNKAAWVVRRNGVEIATPADTSFPDNPFNAFVGAEAAASWFFNGHICELAVHAADVGAGGAVKEERYLGKRFGVVV